MAIQDIFHLQHKWQDNDGRQCSNDYFYKYIAARGLGLESDEEALSVAWVDAVLTPMNATIPNTYRTTEVKVVNLFNPAFVWVQPMALVGGRSGAGSELMPQFNTAKATLSHNSGLINKGRKMFGGLFESDQINGLLTVAGYTNFALRAALAVVWVVDSLTLGQKSFQPVVVKRIKVVDAFTGKTTYRLPENFGESVNALITSAVTSAVVTSQNTRKD